MQIRVFYIPYFLASILMFVFSCSQHENNKIDSYERKPDGTGDNRFVVLGPSLVEIMFTVGIGNRIVGVDRYSIWPDQVSSIQVVGGYLDPSLEMISNLSPTSIHSVGYNVVLQELSDNLSIPYYSYCFDRLSDVLEISGILSERYPEVAENSFSEDLEAVLDSLRETISNKNISILLVIYHESGSGSLTVVGFDTFLSDLLDRTGLFLTAPATGTYPMISVEGVMELSPELIIYLLPGESESEVRLRNLKEFWYIAGFDSSSVFLLHEDYLLIPGARLGKTAELIAECLF